MDFGKFKIIALHLSLIYEKYIFLQLRIIAVILLII